MAGRSLTLAPGRPPIWRGGRSFWEFWCLDQAHKGAAGSGSGIEEPEKLQFLGPTPENSVAGQIEIVTNAATQGVRRRS